MSQLAGGEENGLGEALDRLRPRQGKTDPWFALGGVWGLAWHLCSCASGSWGTGHNTCKFVHGEREAEQRQEERQGHTHKRCFQKVTIEVRLKPGDQESLHSL